MSFRIRVARLAPLAFALLSSAAFAVTPTVTLSPTGNHPKGTTQVSGTGFGDNEAVDIYFDTKDEVLVATNASGSFGPVALTIPVDAQPGSHWITAVERFNGMAAQHTFLVRTRWNSHGFNERGQRRNPYENVINSANVTNLDVAWTALTGNQVISSPAIAQITSTYDPYVFVGSIDKNLYPFDSTGTLKWKKITGDKIVSSPAVASDTVYVGSDDGNLYAFKAATGALAWASPAVTGGYIETSPAVANGIVYVGAGDGKLYAFYASNGAPAWASPAVTGGSIYQSSPAVADGIVYIGSGDDKMYAFDADTGGAAWASPFATSGTIVSSPAVAGVVVYFGSYDGNIYALNARTGLQRWQVSTVGALSSSPAVANGMVYMGGDDGKLYALRASSGAILWTGTLIGGVAYSSAAVADGVVYVGTSAADIEAFDANGCGASACSPLWTATTGAFVDSSPAISDGMLYFGSNDHRLYAFALDAGDNPAYRFRKPTPPPSFASLHPDVKLKPVSH